MKQIPFVGIDYKFQEKLVKKTGIDHYMTVQIMASNFLNWQFFCVGGSSNLMCILPVRLLSIHDGCISKSVENVVRGLMFRKHGITELPYINMTHTYWSRGRATNNEGMLKKSFEGLLLLTSI